MQNINFIAPLILEILRRYCKLVGYAWIWPPKTMLSASSKLWCLSSYKKLNFAVSYFFPRYCRFLILVLQACLATHTKTIVSPCKKFWYLFTCKKIYLIHHFVLEILHLKNPAIWLVKSILANDLRNTLLVDKGFQVKYK